MKRISATLVCLLISCSIFSQAQDSTIQFKRVEFTSMSAMLGLLTNYEGFPNSVENFRKLAPNSKILEHDFTGKDNNNNYYSTVNSDFAFSVAGYFSIKNKEGKWSKYHPQLRLGITYANQTAMSNYFSESEYFRVDTLISNQSGQAYYVDSVQTDNYSMDFTRDQLYLDAALLISSSPQNLFKIYGGVGFSVGLTFNSKTNLYYSESHSLESGVQTTNYYYFPDSDNSKEEVFLNDESFVALLSLPLGLEAKLSRRDNNWANCRVFIEARPSISYSSIPKVGSNASAAGVWGYGFKYDF